MEKVVKVLWAVPCCYYGSEALLELRNLLEFKTEEIEISGVHDGAEAAKKIYDQKFDLIFLDQELSYSLIFEAFLEKVCLEKIFIIKFKKTGEFWVERLSKEGFKIEVNYKDCSKKIKEILKEFFKRRGCL